MHLLQGNHTEVVHVGHALHRRLGTRDRRHEAHAVGVGGRADRVFIAPRNHAFGRVDHDLDWENCFLQLDEY